MKVFDYLRLNKFLTLKLIKNKIFNLKFLFKTNLKIVFKYYLFNKKILLTGIQNKLNKFIFKLVKNTKHSYILNNLWFKGIFSNSELILKYLIFSKNLNKLIKFLFNLKLNINLILVLTNFKHLNELITLNLPIIGFNNFNPLYDYFIYLFKNPKTYLFFYFFKLLKKKAVFLKNLYGYKKCKQNKQANFNLFITLLFGGFSLLTIKI